MPATESTIASVASRTGARHRRSNAGNRSFKPKVNSEMMTAISVNRSTIEASSTASTRRRPAPQGPKVAGREREHRCAQRNPLQRRAGERHPDEQYAGDDEPRRKPQVSEPDGGAE
jgi:hypothetical protein